MHRSKNVSLDDSESDDNDRQSGACPQEEYVSMKEELEKIARNPKSKMEQKCEASLSYLKKHLKFSAYQTLIGLRKLPDEQVKEWYDMVLSIAEKISFLEDTEPILPLHPDGLKATYHNIGGVTRDRMGVEMFWEVKECRRRWKELDQMYHAEIAFLQREAQDPYYELDLEKECSDLCARRAYVLRRQAKIMQEWEEMGAAVAHYSIQCFKVEEELRELNPERLLDRVRLGVPVKPGELATELDWEKIPSRIWPRRPRGDQIVELLLNVTTGQDEKKHVVDPEVVAKHALWTKQHKRHLQRIRSIKRDREELKANEELHGKVALRIQKRSAELREEAAVLKEWLAQGHLHSVYAFRFAEIQKELRDVSCENLIRTIEESESDSAEDNQ